MKFGNIVIPSGHAILFQITMILILSEAYESFELDWIVKYASIFSKTWQPLEVEVALLINFRNSAATLQQLQLPVRREDLTSLDEKINLKKPSVFLIHGFLSDGREVWLRRLSRAYLEQKDVNVFIVDWGSGAKNADYFDAVDNTYVVAAKLTKFIKLLTEETKSKASPIHIIGHSLGAQIAGQVGRKISKIDRITGLDPALPGFSFPSPRLSSNDAAHVDVIHTSTIFGTFYRLGHVDIYMNGGMIQPGCETDSPLRLDEITCSHSRAKSYLIESMENLKCLFVASRTTDRANRVTSKDFNPREDTVLGLDTFKFQSNGVFHVPQIMRLLIVEVDKKTKLKRWEMIFNGIRNYFLGN